MTRRRLTTIAVGALIAILAVLATTRLISSQGPDGVDGGVAGEVTGGLDDDTRAEARAFLETYVDAGGRVVRTDQGGDTVSEGQAYALLLAVGIGDQKTFDRVWAWTSSVLLREDGLLSWRFEDGAVVDGSSASDADIDVARALALAAERFEDPSYAAAASRLGTAVLDHETVETPDGLVLVAGEWATGSVDGEAAVFNPSYVSPVATTMLAELTGDPRWAALTAGSRAAVEAITGADQLPPDWAEISPDGSVRAVSGPAGAPVQFGYDAARTLLRHAESCDPADRTLAAEGSSNLGVEEAVARYDLAGSPQTDDASPLTLVAQAAGRAAAGERSAARESLDAAADARDDFPTYYGDAWAALGPMLLTSDVLGSCPLLSPTGQGEGR